MPRLFPLAIGVVSLLLILLFGYYFYLKGGVPSGVRTPKPTPTVVQEQIVAIVDQSEYIGQVTLPAGWTEAARCAKFIHLNPQGSATTCQIALDAAAITIFADTAELYKTFLSQNRTNIKNDLTIGGKKALSFDVGRYKATVVFYKEGRALYLTVKDMKYLDVYNKIIQNLQLVASE